MINLHPRASVKTSRPSTDRLPPGPSSLAREAVKNKKGNSYGLSESINASSETT